MSRGRIIALLVLLATVLFALAPLVRGRVEIPTAQHHLLHAVMLAGAALSGVLFAGSSARERRSGAGWLVVAMVTPVLAMLLMWPSEYAYLETHPYGHAVEHGGLIFFGFVTGYGGQRYANGIGWAAGISLVTMAFLAIWGYGVAPATATANLVASPVVSNALTAANVAHGKLIFAQNCAVCHGATGAGGEGPPLKNERTRKSLAQTQQWIENPAPPMPKLYPSVLSSQDVLDVAAYVQSLH